MSPVTAKYIKNEYINSKDGVAVQVNGLLEKEIIKKARRVLALQRKGVEMIFPDVLKIERELVK